MLNFNSNATNHLECQSGLKAIVERFGVAVQCRGDLMDVYHPLRNARAFSFALLTACLVLFEL